MKKKIIPATLISIICIGIVCAAINFDNLHEEGSLHTEKGWNLIYGFFNPEEQLSANSDISADDIEAVYAYIPTTNEYARAYPEPEVEKLRQIDDDELLNTAFWVYSDKSGTIVYEIYDNSYIPFDERPLYQGWNFLGLMPEMKMKKLSELKGTCNIEKIVFWQHQQWEILTPETLSQSTHPDAPESFEDLVLADSDANIGMGMIFYVSDNCNLGIEETSLPPEIPAQCPEGYTLTAHTYPQPAGAALGYYCKINKDWPDFELCTNDDDCPEDYSCLSQLDGEEFRCVPLAHWEMHCWCESDGACVCV